MQTARIASALFASLAAAVYLACGSDPDSTFEPVDGGKDSAGGQSEAGKDTGGIIGDDPDAETQVPATDVDVVITTDNAYAFAWGNASGLATLKGRPITNGASDIFDCPVNTTGSGAAGFGPESYVVAAADAPTNGFLYIVGWDDNSVTQGVLAQFKRRGGAAVYSGASSWEVCATGEFYNSIPGSGTSDGPSIATVNTDIGRCNAGSIDTTKGSGGWVNTAGAVVAGSVGKLAVGEDNSDASGQFPITCQLDNFGNAGVDAQAKWMWYTPDARNAFSDRDTRSYLIFRIPTKALPPPPN